MISLKKKVRSILRYQVDYNQGAAFGYLTLAISRILDIVEGSDYVSQLKEASSYLDKLTEKAEDSDINKLSLDICESCLLYTSDAADDA